VRGQKNRHGLLLWPREVTWKIVYKAGSIIADEDADEEVDAVMSAVGMKSE
jgi:hypothetical protein